MRQYLVNNGRKLVVVSALSAPLAASAAVDTAGVITEIGGAATAVAAVGAAVLLVIVGIKVFKWIARAM